MAIEIPLVDIPDAVRIYFLSRGYFSGHQGLDMVGVGGQPVRAAESGIVFASSWDGDAWGIGGGNCVIIDHFGPGGRRAKTSYAHLKSRAVVKGQGVLKGQIIGYADTTGNSTGNHLHFSLAECKMGANPALYYSYVWMNPYRYMRAHGFQNGSVGNGDLVNSLHFHNTVLVKPHANLRAGASTGTAIKRTTGNVGERTTYLGTVKGQYVNGNPYWDKLWHPKAGIVYLHTTLGEWVL